MKFLFIFLVCIISPFYQLQSQTYFKPGYVITLTGDTIYGEIDYRGDLLMTTICKFKDSNQKITEYSPHDILAYRFIQGKYFIAKSIHQNTYFFEYLLNGKISVYHMRDDFGDHYYISKNDSLFSELPYQEGIKYVNEQAVYYKSNKHIGILNLYMQDAPELKSRINEMTTLDPESLVKLAKDYHQLVCKDNSCIEYEKLHNPINILSEFSLGLAHYTGIDNLIDKNHLQPGLTLHIWMPAVNEKLYLRTGFFYTRLNFTNGKVDYLRIPVQLEYIYPKGIFRPRISYGFNVYFPFDRSVSTNIGANIKLTTKTWISVTTEFEFQSAKLVIPKYVLSNAFNIGILFKL